MGRPRTLVLDQVTLRLSAAGGDSKRVDVTGTSVRCIGATNDFRISFDNGNWIPFGVARRIAPLDEDGQRYTFEQIRVDHDGNATNNVITLVIGDAGFEDTRAAFFPAQAIRTETAARIMGANKVWADGGAGYMQVSAEPGCYKLNVRNTDATRNLQLGYGDLSGADVTALVAGGGYILGPGENVDFDVVGSTVNWSANPPLWVVAQAGQTFVVSQFCFRQ